jgi:hypothetical protein
MFFLRKGVYLVIFLILLSSSSFALKVFPTLTKLGDDYYNKHSFILTILNDEPNSKRVILTIDPDSYYLKDYVEIEPSDFMLESNSKINVQVTTRFPKDLSPELHQLIIKPLSQDSEGEKTVYEFKVPGIAKPNLQFESFSVKDIPEGDSLILNITLNNKGNVIAKAYPHIFIYDTGNNIIDELKYKSKVLVMPFKKYVFDLRYDASNLVVGNYKAKLEFDYNGNLKTSDLEQNFKVIGSNTNKSFSFSSGFLIKIGALIAFLLAIASFVLFPGKKTNKTDRFKYLDKRISKLDKEVNDLVHLTHNFIEDANKWFNDNLNGRFKFE